MLKINIKTLLTVLLITAIKTSENPYDAKNFNLINYEDINTLMEKIKSSASNSSTIRIKDIFSIYPEITPPICSKTSKKTPCKSYLIEISDFEKGESYTKKKPTILLIAGFHGNEVTGTNSLYQTLSSLKKHHSKTKSLTDIIQNTRILIYLTANINGFYNQKREETYNGKSHDPNRDFPYNLQTGSKCFKTTTAMLLNNIFRDNLIVACLTYHGGDNSISYPWGNFAHEQDPLTGDDVAFGQVSEFLKKAAGGNQAVRLDDYHVGNLQSTVYDVYGGFEDWAYGASWDLVNVPKKCSANQEFVADVRYGDNSNRAFVFLVEAGYEKIPGEGQLGNEVEIFLPGDGQAVNGYVSRNGFLSLRFAEVMKPFVVFDRVFYEEGFLNFQAVVKGCLQLDGFSEKNLNLEIVEKSYNEKYSYFNLNFRIANENVDVGQLDFLFNCDKEWHNKTMNKSPETHLVKMRTFENYNVKMNNYEINNKNYTKTTLLNINIDNLENSKIVYSGNNIYSLVYTRKLIIKTLEEQITLTDDKNIISISSEIPKERKLILEIKKLTEDNKNNKLTFDLQNEKEIKMTEDNFYNLLGRTIYITEGDKTTKSTIKLEEAQKDSFLFIPANGLSGTIKNDFGNFIFKILLKDFEFIKFEILTNNEQDFKLVINNKEFLFNEKTFVKRNEKEIFKFEKEVEIDFENLNQWRILGDNFLYDDLKGENFVFELNQNNSYIDEFLDVEFELLNVKIDQKPSSKSNVFYFCIILLILMILLTFLYFVISKKFRDKVYNNEVDLGLRNIELTV